MRRQWCIPEVGAQFVWRMEDVLDLYEEAYDPKKPTVCFDELPYRLVAEKRVPISARPGRAERYDYEYERRGTTNLLAFFEPRGRFRHLEVSTRRTKQDFALFMRRLVDEHYPDARKVRVVLDNLNTHTPAALYESFEPAEARRIVSKLWSSTTRPSMRRGSIRWRSSSRCSRGSVWAEGASRTRRRSGVRSEHGSESATREERQ